MTTSNCSCHLLADNDVSSIISNPFIQETVWGGGGGLLLQVWLFLQKLCWMKWIETPSRVALIWAVVDTFTIPEKAFDCYANAPTFYSSTPPSAAVSSVSGLRLLKHSSPKAARFSGRLPSSPSASHDTSQTANPHNPFLCVMVTAAQQWSSWMRSCGPSLV